MTMIHVMTMVVAMLQCQTMSNNVKQCQTTCLLAGRNDDDTCDDDGGCKDLLEDVDLEAVLVAAKEQSVDPSEYQLHV